MNESIRVGLTKMGDPVRRAGLDWALEDISARFWEPACNTVDQFHRGDPRIKSSLRVEPLALWEWTSHELTSNVAMHLIACALEQHLGLEPKLKESLKILSNRTAGTVLGRLIMCDVDKYDNVKGVVCVERIRVGDHELFRPLKGAHCTGDLRIPATKKVLARMRDWVNDRKEGETSRVGKHSPVKKLDPIVVPNAGDGSDVSKRLGQRKLSDFALLREAARIIGVEISTLRQALGSGRLQSYNLAGGRKVVDINECKSLWPNGGSDLQGRHANTVSAHMKL